MTVTAGSGTRPDEVRRHNRAALLRSLHLRGPSTRATLATELALNRSTIKALVDGLTEDGLVAERVPALRSGVGRPSLLVVPQPHAAAVLAVDVRVEQVAMAVVGMGGQIMGRRSWRLSARRREPIEVFTTIVESTGPLTDELGMTLSGVGVSVPGVVRRGDGLVHEAPNLRWTDVPLGDWLRHALRLPVAVANDAELGALAEHLRGVATGADDMVYLSADIGVGGGVISGGTALRGSGGYVGEFGHMVVRPDGRQCYCGLRGCWETEVGEHAMARALGMPEDSARGSIVAELRDPGVSSRLAGFTGWLATGLCNVVNLLGPELVVLGDLLAALPADVVAELAEVVQRRSMVSRAIGGTRVVPSALGVDAKLIGAAELAFEPVLAAS